MSKTDFVFKIDKFWRLRLIGVDFEEATIDDLTIDREDGKFFTIRLTRALGYIYPMVFETLNKNGIAGNICLLVRRDNWGNRYVVVEEKTYIDVNGEKKVCVRAFRSSISSPEGSPIPRGTRKDNIYHLHPVELNNMRIAGPVETYVVTQPFNAPLEAANHRLMLFEDYAAIDDSPGQAVLCQYLLAKK